MREGRVEYSGAVWTSARTKIREEETGELTKKYTWEKPANERMPDREPLQELMIKNQTHDQ